MIAIETRYLGPTTTRGSRIVATADITDPTTGRDRIRVIVGYDHAARDPHRIAAERVIDRAALRPLYRIVADAGTTRGRVYIVSAGPIEEWMAR